MKIDLGDLQYTYALSFGGEKNAEPPTKWIRDHGNALRQNCLIKSQIIPNAIPLPVMKKWAKTCVIFSALLAMALGSSGQRAPGRGIAPLQDVVIMVDTLSFSYAQDRVTYRDERHLAFYYETDATVAEVRLFPIDNLPVRPELSILPSEAFDVLDTLVWVNDAYYRTRLRFKSLSSSEFLSLTLQADLGSESRTLSIPMLPYTETQVRIYTGDDDLYVGEEKRFELITNNLTNLKLDGIWKTKDDLEYRLRQDGDRGFLEVIPGRSGAHSLELELETKRPMLSATLKPFYTLEPIHVNFLAKGSRLAFLRMDQREVVRPKDMREGIEVQIDYNRSLQMGKTYRIEDREQPGGPLIAEIFTQRLLSNDRVLCILRPYENHQSSEGYLFIKDGDVPKFITNVNISPEARITGVAMLREGGEWTSSRTIRPGETIDLRLEGEGLRLARFYFEGLEVMEMDSVTRSDRSAQYKLKVPIDIKRRTVEIYNRDEKMGVALAVSEFHRPRPLDFVTIDYGAGPKVLNEINQTILYNHIVREIVIDFDYDRIDEIEKLYGKQMLELEVRLTNKENDLLEMQQISLISICPGDASPRSGAYGSAGCNMQPIRINSILSRKTHSLKEWSRIEIVIRHKTDRYEGEGYSQRVSIVQQKLATFDVELSLPAGLVIQRFGQNNLEGLAGISLAMLAQFSFYDKEAVQKMKPYKLGGGFLFINAFNLNPEVTDRDLGIVMLGSVYPAGADKKLSFPLYGGGGYFLNDAEFFLLLGLGIRLSF